MRFEGRYDELLRQAGAVADAPDALPAELAVSGLLGSAWSAAASGEQQALRAGLVDYLADRPGRTALALLRAAASTGSPAERATAERAANAMAGTGVAEPGWTAPAGQVQPGSCWSYGDVYGDQESVLACFGYPPDGRPGMTEPPRTPGTPVGHALVLLVDHNLGGIVKDMFCGQRADRALAAIGRANEADGPMSVLTEITGGQARARWERAFAACRAAVEPPVGQNARVLWALASSRLTRLPDPPASNPDDQYDATARAGIVREFLASAPARALPDPTAAAECAGLIVEHGCDYDGGNPLRISPAKTEIFLLYWLPRRIGVGTGPDPAVAAAMPATLDAWVRWAAAGQGMSGQPLAEVAAAIHDCTTRFAAGRSGQGPPAPGDPVLGDPGPDDPGSRGPGPGTPGGPPDG